MIVVVYRPLKEFNVTINYLDAETGEALGEPYSEVVIEGGSYNVSHLDNEVTFEKYNYVETQGDLVDSNVQDDVVIDVFYERKSVPMTPLVPAYPNHYNVTVRYVDEEGNEIHPTFVQEDVKAGSTFDVSDLDNEIIIKGYRYVETQGETSGVVDGDKEVVVVFSQIPTHDITVRYEDKEGNELQDPFIQKDVEEGSHFDVSDKDDEVEIPGYVYEETKGNTEGTVDGDEEIIVVYRPLKDFNVTINYLDVETGEALGEPHHEVITEGGSLNVSHLDDEVTFEKYNYVRTDGDLVQDSVQDNVTINVYYERKSVPMTPLVPAYPIGGSPKPGSDFVPKR